MDVRQHVMDAGQHVMDVNRHVTHFGQLHYRVHYWVHVECLLLQQLANAKFGAVASETVFIRMQCSNSIRNRIHLDEMLSLLTGVCTMTQMQYNQSDCITT